MGPVISPTDDTVSTDPGDGPVTRSQRTGERSPLSSEVNDGVPKNISASESSRSTRGPEKDSPAAEPPPIVLGMTSSDRWLALIVSLTISLLLLVHWVRLTGWGLQPIEVDRPSSSRYRFVLDVNSATWVEWMQLEGIGETLARRIVAHRERHGPFQSVDDVQSVHGIGPKTIARLRPYLMVRPAEHQENAAVADVPR